MQTATLCPTSTATILACQKIAKTFKENIYELSRVRPDWDPEYATSLNVWIADTIEKNFADSLDALENTRYTEWHNMMVAALQHLKVLRASMKVDFKNDKQFLKAFFKKVGYTDYFSDAKNGDHWSLFQFLKTFKNNLDDEDRKRIVAKGTLDSLFDKILECADKTDDFKDCFIALTDNNVLDSYGEKEVSQIYSAIQDICRIAIAYYQFDPLKRAEFNYYKVLMNL